MTRCWHSLAQWKTQTSYGRIWRSWCWCIKDVTRNCSTTGLESEKFIISSCKRRTFGYGLQRADLSSKFKRKKTAKDFSAAIREAFITQQTSPTCYHILYLEMWIERRVPKKMPFFGVATQKTFLSHGETKTTVQEKTGRASCLSGTEQPPQQCCFCAAL